MSRTKAAAAAHSGDVPFACSEAKSGVPTI